MAILFNEVFYDITKRGDFDSFIAKINEVKFKDEHEMNILLASVNADELRMTEGENGKEVGCKLDELNERFAKIKSLLKSKKQVSFARSRIEPGVDYGDTRRNLVAVFDTASPAGIKQFVNYNGGKIEQLTLNDFANSSTLIFNQCYIGMLGCAHLSKLFLSYTAIRKLEFTNCRLYKNYWANMLIQVLSKLQLEELVVDSEFDLDEEKSNELKSVIKEAKIRTFTWNESRASAKSVKVKYEPPKTQNEFDKENAPIIPRDDAGLIIKSDTSNMPKLEPLVEHKVESDVTKTQITEKKVVLVTDQKPAIPQEEVNSIAEELFSDYVNVVVKYDDKDNSRRFIFEIKPQFWPRLPMGCAWLPSKVDGSLPTVIRHQDALEPLETEVVVYGPNAKKDDKKRVNYVTLFNGVNVQSYANTRDSTYQGKRDYPMSLEDYSGYVRGHCVDHADTITRNKFSTKDPRNYIPEVADPIYWTHFRNHWIKGLRKKKCAYMQLPYYSVNSSYHFADAKMTVDGTKIPAGVYLSSINFDRSAWDQCVDVSWGYNFSRVETEYGKGGKTYHAIFTDWFAVEKTNMPVALICNGKEHVKPEPSLRNQKLTKELQDQSSARSQFEHTYRAAELESQAPINKLLLADILSSKKIHDEKATVSYLKRAAQHAEIIERHDIKGSVINAGLFNTIATKAQASVSGYTEEVVDFWRQKLSHS